MRKIVAGLFMSVDGVDRRPRDVDRRRTSPPRSARSSDRSSRPGTRCCWAAGRTRPSPESFADDTSGNPMAAQMNAVRKVVVSTSLDRADWQNTTLVRGDVVDAVRALKDEDGANINMSGSATLAVSLLRGGLLDQLDLLVFPVVGGPRSPPVPRRRGQHRPRVFSAHDSLDNGVMHVVYGPSA